MRNRPLIVAILALAAITSLVVVLLRSIQAPAPAPSAIPTPAPAPRTALLPLNRPLPVNPEKALLGERLFFDKRLSRDNSVACVDCHDLNRGGTDRQAVSRGVDGQRGTINAPTVFNAALSFAQFWDGRASSLEEQAAGPIHNPLEMASNWQQVTEKLQTDAHYSEAFTRLYPGGLSALSIVDAIASFERTLLTPNSRLDQFLEGNEKALSQIERNGYRKFLDYGCASCHQGVALGGNMYQRFGVMRDYFKDRVDSPADLGRFRVTGREEDRHVFKVPSLRNIALTAPYFHDASATTLEEAVAIMGRYQLGRELTSEDVKCLSAFLRSLTGEWRGQPLR